MPFFDRGAINAPFDVLSACTGRGDQADSVGLAGTKASLSATQSSTHFPASLSTRHLLRGAAMNLYRVRFPQS
jgi:hypothetical protein